jgi:hypothetical protein
MSMSVLILEDDARFREAFAHAIGTAGCDGRRRIRTGEGDACDVGTTEIEALIKERPTRLAV